MSETKWRDEDDPEVLAAAVAAGVEVQCVAVDGRTWETGCDDSASFRRCMANDCRYRIPADWQPTPEPPADDLRERTAPNPMAVREFASKVADYVATNVNADAMSKRGWAIEAVVQALEEPTASQEARAILAIPAPPVPPWPGDENDDTARLSPDQGDRIVNACCRMLGCEPADIDGDAALEEILTEAVERCADLHGQDRCTETGHGIAVGCWNDPANTIDDLAAEVQLRAPGHVEEYAAAEQLLRLRINEWESKR